MFLITVLFLFFPYWILTLQFLDVTKFSNVEQNIVQKIEHAVLILHIITFFFSSKNIHK